MCTGLWPEHVIVWGHLFSQNLSSIIGVFSTHWSDVFSLLYLSLLLPLWSSSSLSSLRKTPSLPGPECRCFMFHPPTSPLCSMAHLAVISQHLKAIIPKYECTLVCRLFFFLHLPLCLMGKNKRSRNQGVECLQAKEQHIGVCQLYAHTHKHARISNTSLRWLTLVSWRLTL